ncbi:serine/threonine protein kinase [Cohnella terricola]|uniref:non-specific serine/threonine protein kinase n=1 Tax=Cohnella terricola TaxID=1289167 RepID=A0A559JQZ3_9BACL|nr:serine/threonine-protein kinase [Cohnella terricola]TVY02287.1 serine/threonine protein kinase [Cohnella terricola]
MEHGDPHALELVPEQLFGERYKVVKPIGKGGMGRVYLVEDLRLGGKTRALKLTRPLPEERRSFLPEAELLSELDHPHLPAIVDYFPPDEEGVACIVMEYIPGDTLAQRFERYGLKLGFAFVLDVLIDLCEVLTYLHAQSPPIVFRDLKPANVLLGRHDQAVLVDFGIARRYRPSQLNDTFRLGTPGFAAPEQLRGEQSDGRTDLYGLGALAYFLLSAGQFAIRHRGPMGKALQDDVPIDFVFLLERLLANEPDRRPQTARELLNELQAVKLELVGGADQSLNYSNNGHDREKTAIVAVASAYPGAGATFVALALSSALDRAGISHALVEYPGRDAELYSLLNGAKRMPGDAVFASADGRQPAAPAWRHGNAAYYPLDPEGAATANRNPDKEFTKWIRRLGVPLVLLDVSSRWDEPDVTDWLLRSADRITMVADCYPAKWSTRRQAACLEIHLQANRRFIVFDWIANRDQPFADRNNWLSLLPVQPEAHLPELPGPSVLEAIWRGEGMPKDAATQRIFERVFSRVIRSYSKAAQRS